MIKIRIFFVDFWDNFDFSNNFITKILDKKYEIVITPDPDYLFFSVYGYNHIKYRNCIKILYSGENIEPDFNLCDYAIAFQHLIAKDRYIRFPLYLIYGFEQLNNDRSLNKEKILNRKFCNFVYSNSKLADPIRETFFKKLQKYKKVDSGGRLLNNIGKPVVNKLDFIKDYKFTIAFENSLLSGYTTEKILEPMLVNSMPIYYGNPDIHLDFNKESFICVNDFETIDQAIDEIIRLDNNDEAYIQKLSSPWYIGDNYNCWELKLLVFLENIFEQGPKIAKRTTDYGCVKTYRRKQESIGMKRIIHLTIFDREFSLCVRKIKSE